MNVDELYTKEHHDNGSEMQVRNEHGKKLSMFITLAGIDSKSYRSEKVNLSRKVLKDPEGDLDLYRAESLAEMVIDWRGFKSKGKKLNFTKKLASQLFYNAPYLMDQADSFVYDRVNFIKR